MGQAGGLASGYEVTTTEPVTWTDNDGDLEVVTAENLVWPMFSS